MKEAAATEAVIAANPLPPGFVDIKTVPVEAEAACRPASSINLVTANGVFTDVQKTVTPVVVRGYGP